MQERRRIWWIGVLAGLLAASALADPGRQNSREEGRPWMGVFLDQAVDGGVRLVAVVPGGPAQLADLRPGDILIQASDAPLVRTEDLTRVLEGMRAGNPLELQLLRSGEVVQRVLGLAPRPAQRAWVTLPRAPAPRSGCRAYGLRLSEATPDLRRHYGAPGQLGVLVTGIDPRRGAANDGFRVGDVLVRLGEVPVRRVSDVEQLLHERGARGEALQASLIRSHAPARLTLKVSEAPAVDAVSPEDRPSAPGQAASSRVRFEQALQLEIERLRSRIEELKHELETLR